MVKKGANNLAKVLYRKKNKELCSTIERYKQIDIYCRNKRNHRTLSVEKTPKKDGKVNSYVELLGRHVILLDAATTASRKVFLDMFIR